jgi:NAD(P)-dependent dehydrogenase (short-subunit alcohol dehydrogenase family)
VDGFPPMAMPEEANMASANKAVIVTGAASGIGLAMTMGLITAGHDVTAVDRNAAALVELGKEAARLNGVACRPSRPIWRFLTVLLMPRARL